MPEDRAANIAKGNEELREKLADLYEEINKGFQAQGDRANATIENWKIYNCEYTANQLYNGRNRLVLPLVYEAVQARATRFVNQLFPSTGRHVEATSEDGTLPRAALSLCEHYITATQLRELAQALVVAGDCEGQYSVYVSWQESFRFPVRRVETPVEIGGGLQASEKAPDISEEEEMTGGPCIEIIPDSDILFLPTANCDGVDDALVNGGSVTIVRRWNRAKIKKLIKHDEIDKEEGEALLADMDKHEGAFRDTEKELAYSAGIKKDNRGKWALIYEIWADLEIEKGGDSRFCQVYMAGNDRILMARRNPLWCDKCPLISIPVERLPGVPKGIAPVTQVAKLQYYATDVLNETADSATYSLLPIIFRDPAMNTSPLVLAPAAVWDVSPADVKFAEFPPLYREGLELLAAIKAEIFQVLNVNPAMISSQASQKKLNQAEVAQEQAIDQLTTADAVTVLEAGIFSPLVNLFMDLDYQYRQRDITVRQYGEMGIQANSEAIPPMQSGTRYQFYWVGVEVSRSQQQMQQKIAALNIMKAIPPQAYPQYTLDLSPVMVDLAESVYGPQQARLILKDLRSQLSIDPERENGLLELGHYCPVHPQDNHQEHMASHSRSIELSGDPFQAKMMHIQEHMLAIAAMQQAQQAAMMGAPPPGQGGPPGQEGPPGPQSVPGGAAAMQGPGARPGAQPSPMRPAQGPPGMIAPDQMMDATRFPRRAG
jgi:hypothetical protein